MTDPHASIGPILAFLQDYYAQVDRLLSDITSELQAASPAWQRLRRMGNSYESTSEFKVGQPDRFVLRHLGHWYAPVAAFSTGSIYGADAAKTVRLAFAGVWIGTRDNPPELYAGWIEGMTLAADKSIETQLLPFNAWLEPDDCTPPQQLTRLDALVFEPRALESRDNDAKLAMARTELANISDPAHVSDFVRAWLNAMNRS